MDQLLVSDVLSENQADTVGQPIKSASPAPGRRRATDAAATDNDEPSATSLPLPCNNDSPSDQVRHAPAAGGLDKVKPGAPWANRAPCAACAHNRLTRSNPPTGACSERQNGRGGAVRRHSHKL